MVQYTRNGGDVINVTKPLLIKDNKFSGRYDLLSKGEVAINAGDAGKSSNNLEIKTKKEYNGNADYSLYTDEIIFSSRYTAVTQTKSTKMMYDRAKKGDSESAFKLLSHLIKNDIINKIGSFGNEVYLLPVVGVEGTSANVLPRNIAEYIGDETEQGIFKGIYKKQSSNSREIRIWGRMKENYPEFILDEKSNIKTSDIAGKKFILIDDNSTTGRTFVGLKNFIEENSGEVVSYYALTTGQDQSEKMITTDETWNELLNLGLDEVKDFAEKEGIKREISNLGLTERETQELLKHFKREGANTRRGDKINTRNGSSSSEIQGIYETDEKEVKSNFSLKSKDSEGNTLTSNERPTSNPDINFSLKDTKISIQDVRSVQNIGAVKGRISVNDFDSNDIKATENFARKYFAELGVKSPFFRAFFGDWRANDETPVMVATQKGADRGITKNKDTDWDIQISGKVFNETTKQKNTAANRLELSAEERAKTYPNFSKGAILLNDNKKGNINDRISKASKETSESRFIEILYSDFGRRMEEKARVSNSEVSQKHRVRYSLDGDDIPDFLDLW